MPPCGQFLQTLVHILVFTRLMNVFIFITVGHSDFRLLATKILLIAGGHFLCGQEEEENQFIHNIG